VKGGKDAASSSAPGSPLPDATVPWDAGASLDASDGSKGPRSQIYLGTFVNFVPPYGGSTAIEMTLWVAPDGIVRGTFLFGGGPLLEPPTDPNADYPPLIPTSPAPFSSNNKVPFPYLEHFLFTVRNGTLQGSRLRFELDVFEIWARWCALQTEIYVYPPSVTGAGAWFTLCVPDGGRAGFCKACTCTANACAVDTPDADLNDTYPNPPLRFDIQILGRSADGSVLGLGDAYGASSVARVHFDEAPL
jgi:hypothetical protein